MKKEWKRAEISILEVKATALTDKPVTGVDQEWTGDDGLLHFKVGVKYNSGSATNLTLTGDDPVEIGHELFG